MRLCRTCGNASDFLEQDRLQVPAQMEPTSLNPSLGDRRSQAVRPVRGGCAFLWKTGHWLKATSPCRTLRPSDSQHSEWKVQRC